MGENKDPRAGLEILGWACVQGLEVLLLPHLTFAFHFSPERRLSLRYPARLARCDENTARVYLW